MVSPLSSTNRLADIQNHNQLEQQVVTSKEVKILSEIFGQDVAEILAGYAVEHGFGQDGILDRSDLLPDNVLQFLNNLACDAKAGADTVENWRHDYEDIWNKMTPSEKELTLKLVEELLGESVDIEALIQSTKTGVTEAKSADQIKAIIDGPDGKGEGEYTFTYQGEEYTLSKDGNNYVCTNSDGEEIDGKVNFNMPPGWIKIYGMPEMDKSNALYIGTDMGRMGFMEGPRDLGKGYDDLQELLDEGTVLWHSGDVLVEDDSHNVKTPMDVKDIRDFVKNNGVYEFSVGGKDYELVYDAKNEKYQCFDADGNLVAEGEDIDWDTKDGVLEIKGFDGDDSLYLFDNGSKLSMSIGKAGVSDSKLEDETLVLYESRTDDADDYGLLKTLHSPGDKDVWGIPKENIADELKADGADVNWTKTDEYAIAVIRKEDKDGNEYFDTYVYDLDSGDEVTRIWGDPHVDQYNKDGTGSTAFDFYGDSSFILPDGTKICLNTTDHGYYDERTLCTGVNICHGESRVNLSLDEDNTTDASVRQTFDRYEWDADTADFETKDVEKEGKMGEEQGYVFALYENGDGENEWAVWNAENSEWYDVTGNTGDQITKGTEALEEELFSEDIDEQMDDEIKEIHEERTGTDEADDVDDADDVDLIGDAMTEEEATDKAIWTVFDKIASGDLDADALAGFIGKMEKYYDTTSSQVGPGGQYDYVDPGYQITPWGPGGPGTYPGGGAPGSTNQWGVPHTAANNILPKWKSYVVDCASRGGPVDIYALVMHVLRESYMETLQDLRHYAQKVQFYNDLKKQIRKELDRARTELANEAQNGFTSKYIDVYPGIDPDGNLFAKEPSDIYPVEEQHKQVTINPGDKDGLETHIKKVEEQLNSVGDDAQLANVDLQTWMQKQTQTIQLLSNVSKMIHDTAMAIIRKIG